MYWSTGHHAHFPLWGITGDLLFSAAKKSPLLPCVKGGKLPVVL
jgi:hypothetical protein